MTLILFLCSVFGLLFVMRTLSVFRARGVIRAQHVTKTGTVMVAALIFAAFLSRTSVWSAFFAIIALTLSPLIWFLLYERKRLAEMREQLPRFLDAWILNLRLGNSANAARDAALREESEELRALLTPLFSNAANARAEHLLLPPETVREFARISRATHAPLTLLENLRAHVRKTAEFRRKSGQAVRQTAIQSSVMLILLFALAIFTVRRYGWTRNADLVTISALISLFGVLLMFHLARKTKWKL